MAICVDTNGISVGDRHLPFYAGSVDYWRHPVEAWKPLLERVKGLAGVPAGAASDTDPWPPKPDDAQ